MNFKYCRAYSWPYNEDRWSISEAYFAKMVKRAKELESELPCDFLMVLAYEEKEFPFVLIALAMDYHSVADSDITRILDDFERKLGDPKPGSLENPGWFDRVDPNYKSLLASCGVTLCEGEFYRKMVKPNTEAVHPPLQTNKPSEADIQNVVSYILRPDNPFAQIETSEDSDEDPQTSRKWWKFW